MVDIKITKITPEDESKHRSREGFYDICNYGSELLVEDNEIGGIFKNISTSVKLCTGVYAHQADLVERIFLEHTKEVG